MSPPTISILLPVRDAAATIETCLRSIQRQVGARWECVVADDGSEDGSAELAETLSRGDRRLRVLRLARRGLVATLGEGLQECHGEYVARMDADDIMHSHRLPVQVAALEESSQLAAVGSRVRLFPTRNVGEGMGRYVSWLNSISSPADVGRNAFIECPIAHPSLLIRRAVLADLGYRDMGWPEDYDLILRLLAGGHTLGVVPRRLLAWRHHHHRLSRTDPRYHQRAFTACKAAFLSAGFLADVDTYGLWGYGTTGRELSRALAAHGKRPAYIVELHPGRLGNRIQGAPVIPPEALTRMFRRPLLVSVSGADARALIRRDLQQLEWIEGRDYVCAA